MKTKAFKKQRRRIRKLAEKWLGPLGLKWWTIEHRYHDDQEAFLKPNGERVLMFVIADWRYRTASIDVNLPIVGERSGKQLEHDYLHELMHVFLNEMRMTCAEPAFHEHEERVAHTLADAFLWMQRKGNGHG